MFERSSQRSHALNPGIAIFVLTVFATIVASTPRVWDALTFCHATPLRFASPVASAIFYTGCLIALGCMFLSLPREHNWNRCEQLLFDSPSSQGILVAITLLMGLIVFFTPLRYDLVGDNVLLAKYIANPLEQGRKMAIPNSMLYQILLSPWMGHERDFLIPWRWLNRTMILLFVPLAYACARELPRGRLLAFLLILTSPGMYNFFGHIEYYGIQIPFLFLGILAVLKTLNGKWSLFRMGIIYLVCVMDYLAIAPILLLPVLYTCIYRLRHRIQQNRSRTRIYFYGLILLVILGMGIVGVYTTDDSMVPIRGDDSQLHLLSWKRISLGFNLLILVTPLLGYLLISKGGLLIQVIRDAFHRPFQDQFLLASLLMFLPHLFFSFTTAPFCGWFEFDVFSVGGMASMIFFALLATPPASSQEAEAKPTSGFWAGSVVYQFSFTFLILAFFNHPACISQFTNYADRFSTPIDPIHRSNRTSILLAVGAIDETAEWLQRTNTVTFPVSLLNWMDVWRDLKRRHPNHSVVEDKELLPFARNPFFYLTQLQPKWTNTKAISDVQRQKYQSLLDASAQVLPPTAEATDAAFHLLDNESSNSKYYIQLSRALVRYFKDERLFDQTINYEIHLVKPENNSILILDVAIKLTSSKPGDPVDAHYQFLYCFSGANYVTASNLTHQTQWVKTTHPAP